MKALIMGLFFTFSFLAEASSVTKTCSGQIRYCDRYGICAGEHYYLHVYQYLTTNPDGSIKNHRYKFKMRDIVAPKEDYIPRDFIEGDHLVYDGPKFSFAIPVDGTKPIYYFQPNFGVDEWQELCL